MFKIGNRGEGLQEQSSRDNVMTIHAIGTGAGNSIVRMISSWLWWLNELSKIEPEAAYLYGKTIKFIFANTHANSLHDAYEAITKVQQEHSGVNVLDSIQWDLMAEDFIKGKGCPDLKSGEIAIANYLPTAKTYMSDTHLYLPVATCGSGNTGSSAIMQLIKSAIDADTWVMPVFLLSSQEEMDPVHEKFQAAQLAELDKTPVWALIADNAHFTKKSIWNNQLSMVESYNRIDYVLSHALRTLLLMVTHRTQIDESKLEGSIFSGPGGLLSICGVDINPDEEILATEAQRARELLIDSPFKIETFVSDKDEDDRKFSTLVLGITGGLPAPYARVVIEAVKDHPYVKRHLNGGASLLPVKFGSYLPDHLSTMFALLTRERPSAAGIEKIPVKYPPMSHPVIKGLRDLEVKSETRLNAVALGRQQAQVVIASSAPQDILSESVIESLPNDSVSGVTVKSSAVAVNGNGYVPNSVVFPVNLSDSYKNCSEFVKNHNANAIAAILGDVVIPKIGSANIEGLLEIVRIAYQFKLENHQFVISEEWQSYLIDNLSRSVKSKVQSTNTVMDLSYEHTNSISELQKTFEEMKKKLFDQTEKGKAVMEQITLLIMYKTIFNNDLIDSLISAA